MGRQRTHCSSDPAAVRLIEIETDQPIAALEAMQKPPAYVLFGTSWEH